MLFTHAFKHPGAPGLYTHLIFSQTGLQQLKLQLEEFSTYIFNTGKPTGFTFVSLLFIILCFSL